MLLEPADDRHGGAHPVGGLAEAVPLVGKEHVLDRHSPSLQVVHHLLGLHDRHVGVVGAMKDEGRRLHALQLGER